MNPNSVLSAGQLALIAVVAVVCLAIWLGSVFLAARPPRHKSDAETTALPRHLAGPDDSARKAA